jgi:uncharacterized phosphosugar-binding protein
MASGEANSGGPPAVLGPTEQYLQACNGLVERAKAQAELIAQAADWCSAAILAGRVVHLFGSGHSRIMVEEMWPRYGSFPGFNPIVELSLTFHNPVVGANGQRQAMFLENVSGLAARILRNFALDPRDAALVISSSGCNVVPIEMALGFRSAGIRTIGLVSLAHARTSASRHASGKRLDEVVDLVLDTGAPPGDALVTIPGLATPVAPASTVGGCMIVNCLKAEIAERLTRAGQPPLVLTSAVHVGPQRSAELFESAYDEHARRLARLFDRKTSEPAG